MKPTNSKATNQGNLIEKLQPQLPTSQNALEPFRSKSTSSEIFGQQ